jgi:hypothetical protein
MFLLLKPGFNDVIKNASWSWQTVMTLPSFSTLSHVRRVLFPNVLVVIKLGLGPIGKEPSDVLPRRIQSYVKYLSFN